MRANQLRLWLSSMAQILLCALRRIGLQHTQLAHAPCGSIRLALPKIRAVVTTGVRRIKIGVRLSQRQRPARSGIALKTSIAPSCPPKCRVNRSGQTLACNQAKLGLSFRSLILALHIGSAPPTSMHL